MKKYSTMYNENGYNIRSGGLNSKLSDESKRKVSIGNKGKVRTQAMKDHMSKIKTGTIVSKETKRKLSKMRQGEKHSMWGKRHKKESIIKIQEKLSGIPNEIRQKIIIDLFDNNFTIGECVKKYNYKYYKINSIKKYVLKNGR